MTTDERTAWLKTLKVGDEVGIDMGYRNVPSIGKVEAVTKTQIAVDGRRYDRADGVIRGHSYRVRKLTPIEPVREAVERHGLEIRVSGFFYAHRAQELTTDQLRRVAAVLDEPADAGATSEAGGAE